MFSSNKDQIDKFIVPSKRWGFENGPLIPSVLATGD